MAERCSSTLTLRECRIASAATLLVRRGQEADLAARVRAGFGLDLPSTATVAQGEGVLFAWSGPGHWFVLGRENPETLLARLEATCGTSASVIDQSDARVLFELSGPRVREVLAKGLGVDLDPSVFGPRAVRIAPCAHITVQLWRVDAGPRYRIAVARSFRTSWIEWLKVAAAEVGLEEREAIEALEPSTPG